MSCMLTRLIPVKRVHCGAIGSRSKHRFTCKFCGIQRHADLNASHTIRRIAMSADVATGTVNYPQCVNRKI